MKLAKVLGLVAVLGLVLSAGIMAADAAAKVAGKVSVTKDGDKVKDVKVTEAAGKAVVVTGAKAADAAKLDGKEVEVTGKLSEKGDSIEAATVTEKAADKAAAPKAGEEKKADAPVVK